MEIVQITEEFLVLFLQLSRNRLSDLFQYGINSKAVLQIFQSLRRSLPAQDITNTSQRNLEMYPYHGWDSKA
jgi:hypothetical protein